MSDITADKLAQRIVRAGLLDGRQIESVWADLQTRDVPLQAFTTLLLRKNLLTNFQVDRLLKGERTGYFYGNYKVLYLAGSGTFARVYRAVDRETGRMTAVKVLRKRFREDQTHTEAFVREGQIGSKLRHPNIVPIYEVSQNVAEPYLVMDFVEGRTLREFVKIRKKLSPIEAMAMTTDIISGLAYAATLGMQHRDLKMSNVLVTSRGQAKLVDFGLAAVTVGESDGDEFKNPRTIDYAGLERISGVRANDIRSDLYFVGCMLYNMVTGVPPLSETKDRMQRLSAGRYTDVKPITELEPDLPRALVQFVQRSMEINPEKRFASAAEMLEEAKRTTQKMAAEADGSADAAAEKSRLANIPAPVPMSQHVVDEPISSTPRTSSSASEGENKTVMLVESRIDMQDVLRDRLKKHGYRVLIFSDPERAVNRFEEGERVADCVVFSTPELGESALRAFNRFGQLDETKDIPAILFVDQRQTAIIRAAELGPTRVLLSMPLKVKELREALLRLTQPQSL